MKNRILPAFVVFALAALGCGGTVTLPQLPTAGPETTDQLTVPAPSSAPVHLTLSFGAGALTLAPGAKDLVEGTATYNVPDLKPEVLTQGTSIEVKQKDLVGLRYPAGVKNAWDLKLGSTPMDLTINAGAYNGKFELGGLSLGSLTVKDGAATVDLTFSKPNLSEMSLLRYETGASTVRLKGLANANFRTMTFGGGAGDYILDFSGELKTPATVTISTGLTNLILAIPAGVPAEVTTEGGLSNTIAGPGWTQSGNVYSQSGSGPALTFVVKTGAGNLTLTH